MRPRLISEPIPLMQNAKTHALREQNLLDKVGGAAAISELFAFVPIPSHFPYYKKIVLDKHILRELIHASSLNIHHAYEHGKEQMDENIDTLIDHAEQRVLAVRESVGAKEGIKTLSTHVMDAIDSIQYMLEHPGQLRGLSTGYSKLDSMSSGLQGGEMFVIAARPSMGKTSLAMNIVEHIAVDCNTPCAVFSLLVFDLHLSAGVVRTGEKADHVCVLLNGTRFTKVGQHRTLALAGFNGAIELGEHDDGDVEFLGEAFDAGGDFGDFDLAIVLRAAALRGDELKIIDHDHLDAVLLLETARFGAHLHDVETGRFIDEDLRLLKIARCLGQRVLLSTRKEAAGEILHAQACA